MTLIRAIARHRLQAMQLFFGLGGVVLIGQGAAALFGGQPGYRNVWGGLVAAPFAIIIGACMSAMALSLRRLQARSIERNNSLESGGKGRSKNGAVEQRVAPDKGRGGAADVSP